MIRRLLRWLAEAEIERARAEERLKADIRIVLQSRLAFEQGKMAGLELARVTMAQALKEQGIEVIEETLH
jgi:hypothetical protein